MQQFLQPGENVLLATSRVCGYRCDVTSGSPVAALALFTTKSPDKWLVFHARRFIFKNNRPQCIINIVFFNVNAFHDLPLDIFLTWWQRSAQSRNFGMPKESGLLSVFLW